MDHADLLDRAGLFERNAPRYTSYPTAPQFHEGVGPAQVAQWLGRIGPETPVSLYLHIPFCERLCWFCACRTQGTRAKEPVLAYVETLVEEIARVGALIPGRGRVARMHWGGGTPTILPPAAMERLLAALEAAFDLRGAEFSVEIDPTCVDAARIAALVAGGLSRASLGVQDFSPAVQAAIGRRQSFAQTRDVVQALRAAGISGLNADLVYGLPEQTRERLGATLDQLLHLAPTRIALYGYAHVPWMARRQQMIAEEALPGPRARHALFEEASARLVSEGYVPLGIDHFALPGDPLAVAAAEGRLRRNFQGYTDDLCPVLIGLGASAISRFPQGHAQNAAATHAWQACVQGGRLATVRGLAFGLDDRLRGRAIEMLMCDFRLDLGALAAEFGDFAAHLRPLAQAAAQRYPGGVEFAGEVLTVTPAGRPLTRLVAMEFDAYAGGGARHSQAI